MPDPVSVTEKWIKLLSSSLSFTINLTPPYEVNLIALLNKFIKIYYNL